MSGRFDDDRRGGFRPRSRKRADTCRATGKVAHEDYYDAVHHVRQLSRTRRESAGDLNCYRCRACGHWHVGHAAAFSPGSESDWRTWFEHAVAPLVAAASGNLATEG